MPKFACCLPIVGYAYIEVEAESKAEALETALSTPWDELDIIEEYTTGRIGNGNVNYHPMYEADIQELNDG